MADSTPGSGEEKFVVVPLGSDSKKIGQVIGSESCRRILDALTTEPASASQLAELMGVPLTTVQYDIEKLLEAGLIRVERVARTEKMRQMKIYGPVRKLIVVVPEKLASGSPADILKKYLGVFLGILFVGALVEWGTGPGAAPLAAPAPAGEYGAPYAPPAKGGGNATAGAIVPLSPVAESAGVAGRNESAARAPPAAATPAPSAAATAAPAPAQLTPPHLGLWFVLGGTSALALLGAAGWALKRRKKP